MNDSRFMINLTRWVKDRWGSKHHTVLAGQCLVRALCPMVVAEAMYLQG